MTDEPAPPKGETSGGGLPPSEAVEAADVDHATDDGGFNPFAKHLTMLAATGMTVATAEMRPSSPKLFEPVMEPAVSDDFVDWEFLDKLKTWGGALKEPRVKEKEELDHETTEAMREKEPQFILRNLRRVERFTDPDKPIRLEALEAHYGMGDEGSRDHIEELKYAPVQLVEELGHMALGRRQIWMRWLRDGIQWEDHFARELKDDNPGAVWKRAPDGPTPPQPDEAVAGATSVATDGDAEQAPATAPVDG